MSSFVTFSSKGSENWRINKTLESNHYAVINKTKSQKCWESPSISSWQKACQVWSSLWKMKIQVVIDLPKATKGFIDKAETDSTRMYYHGTWVLKFRCWMVRLFLAYFPRSLMEISLIFFFFWDTHKPEHSLYLCHGSLYIMHLFVLWKVSYR